MIKKRRLAESRYRDMTLPDERYRAVERTRQLLLNLCNPKHTPRVPKLVRDEARYCLRHFPSQWDLDRAAEAAPDVFQQQMEPLYRMIKQHELAADNKDT
jgi:hypothetical protein